ncbi:MAG: hypothetical protein PVG61_05490 [Dehalococcoidia bacterium]
MNKEAPGDCPRCPFGQFAGKRKEFLNMESMWLCTYPFVGDVDYLKLMKKQQRKNKS